MTFATARSGAKPGAKRASPRHACHILMESNDPTQSPGMSGEDRLSFVVCRSGQGAEVRGTLHRLTRFVAVFEVYNPYSILQLSEVLTDFRVFMNDRVVYSARAVIANLVNTGIMVICEASLSEEGWIDIDLFSPVHKRDGLLTEFESFIRDTSRVHQVTPEFKVIVADVQIFLSDLRRWMEQVELSVRSLPAIDRIAAEREVLSRLGCELAQGHLFSETLEAAEIDALLERGGRIVPSTVGA